MAILNWLVVANALKVLRAVLPESVEIGFHEDGDPYLLDHRGEGESISAPLTTMAQMLADKRV